jgi:hypothetical protein
MVLTDTTTTMTTMMVMIAPTMIYFCLVRERGRENMGGDSVDAGGGWDGAMDRGGDANWHTEGACQLAWRQEERERKKGDITS